jgi:hypothetical protein
MHTHRIPGRRRTRVDRREAALAAGLALTTVLLVLTMPLLAFVAAVEWKTSSRRRQRLLGVVLVAQLWRAVVWLWLELHGAPHRPWHPCTQCGRPIESPSRARCCSYACRCYARLERETKAAGWIGARAEHRLAALRLRQLADERPEWNEVPF